MLYEHANSANLTLCPCITLCIHNMAFYHCGTRFILFRLALYCLVSSFSVWHCAPSIIFYAWTNFLVQISCRNILHRFFLVVSFHAFFFIVYVVYFLQFYSVIFFYLAGVTEECMLFWRNFDTQMLALFPLKLHKRCESAFELWVVCTFADRIYWHLFMYIHSSWV